MDYGVMKAQQCYLLNIRDIGVTIATLGFDPKGRGLTPLYPSNFNRLLTVGEPLPTRGRMANGAYGNKPKEFESLSLTNLIITNNNL